MGDIYHAGEVYAGSVPIDDTQASEDTVYSSAKVETMVEDVQNSRIFKSLTYSSTSQGFVVPEDGVYYCTSRSSANSEKTVTITRSGNTYQAATLKQPDNITMFAPFAIIQCKKNDVIKIGSDYQSICYRMMPTLGS